MFRTAISVLMMAASALALTLSARVQAPAQPATVSLDGDGPIPRAGQATRVDLLGSVEIYSVAVYVDGTLSDRAHLISQDVPKAVRIEVRYKDDLHRRLALDWRRELIPTLEPAATASLRGTFGGLKDGDVALIAYVPGKGTVVRVNKATAVSGAHHDLMLAFLEHWLGQRPVSEDMKRVLLGSVQEPDDND